MRIKLGMRQKKTLQPGAISMGSVSAGWVQTDPDRLLRPLSLVHQKKSLVPRSQSTAMLQGHRIKGIVISSRIIQVPFLSGRLFGPDLNVLSAAC